MTASWKQLQNYNYNKDEINQITCHPKSSFLAAADDAGDVKAAFIRATMSKNSSKKDLGWKYGSQTTGEKSIVCKFCQHVTNGGDIFLVDQIEHISRRLELQTNRTDGKIPIPLNLSQEMI